MSLTVHLALVFHVFIAVAVMVTVVAVMVCGHHGIGPAAATEEDDDDAVSDYSYPFIVIVVSMVTNAIHFSHFRHQVSFHCGIYRVGQKSEPQMLYT